MAYTWIKLYISIIDNYDVEVLPDRIFKLFIEFQLIARKNNLDGLAVKNI